MRLWHIQKGYHERAFATVHEKLFQKSAFKFHYDKHFHERSDLSFSKNSHFIVESLQDIFFFAYFFSPFYRGKKSKNKHEIFDDFKVCADEIFYEGDHPAKGCIQLFVLKTAPKEVQEVFDKYIWKETQNEHIEAIDMKKFLEESPYYNKEKIEKPIFKYDENCHVPENFQYAIFLAKNSDYDEIDISLMSGIEMPTSITEDGKSVEEIYQAYLQYVMNEEGEFSSENED